MVVSLSPPHRGFLPQVRVIDQKLGSLRVPYSILAVPRTASGQRPYMLHLESAGAQTVMLLLTLGSL